MHETLIMAAFSLVGTLAGTYGGIRASNKLVNYRLDTMQKAVDKHNSVIDRTYKIETCLGVIDNRIKVTEHRLEDLEK